VQGRNPRRPAVPGRDPSQAPSPAVQHPRRPMPSVPPSGARTPSLANVRRAGLRSRYCSAARSGRP
jgi:hypothetical protein